MFWYQVSATVTQQRNTQQPSFKGQNFHIPAAPSYSLPSKWGWLKTRQAAPLTLEDWHKARNKKSNTSKVDVEDKVIAMSDNTKKNETLTADAKNIDANVKRAKKCPLIDKQQLAHQPCWGQCWMSQCHGSQYNQFICQLGKTRAHKRWLRQWWWLSPTSE